MNILLIEDNPLIADGLLYALKKSNYNVVVKNSVLEVSKYLNTSCNIDLAIIDIMLPDGDGFSLYKSKIKDLKIPTIFLTAKDDEDDIVYGLELGADDYIIKPFSTKELLVRVNKILSRYQKKDIIKVNDITFDISKIELRKNNKVVELSPLELKLVNLLFNNLNRVVSRNYIIDQIWEWTGNYVDDHTITVYFKRIREKLGSNIIVTVKGLGYRIDEK